MKTYKGNAFREHKPNFHENSYLAEGAYVIGDVTVGEYSSIWYNCSLRGDDSSITIGRYTNIQDNTVIHVDDDYPVQIGDYVTVGHGAVIHGCTVEDHCLIGIKAVLMDGVVVGRGSIVAAGCVVSFGTIIPPFSLVAGIPGRVKRTISERFLVERHKQAVGYKSLWCELYGILPDNDSEKGDLKNYKLKK